MLIYPHLKLSRALKPYKSNMYLWEPFNAAFKVAMVSASVLLYPQNRIIVHSVIIILSTIAHAYARPFKDARGNVIVLIFCVCDFMGIMTDFIDHYLPQNDKLPTQVFYIVTLSIALVYTSHALVKSLIPKMHELRQKSKEKAESSTYSLNIVLPKGAIPGQIMYNIFKYEPITRVFLSLKFFFSSLLLLRAFHGKQQHTQATTHAMRFLNRGRRKDIIK